MAKYIIKESELRSIIKSAVKEELNEGLGHAALKTLGYAALGAISPGILAQKAFVKGGNILTGNDTITGSLRDFWGYDSDKKKRSERMSDLQYEESIARKYGQPKTVPRTIGNREKLADKVQFTSNVFGNLGRHYEDCDGFWAAKLKKEEEEVNNNPSLLKSRTRRLKVWLEMRDEEYESLIKRVK